MRRGQSPAGWVSVPDLSIRRLLSETLTPSSLCPAPGLGLVGSEKCCLMLRCPRLSLHTHSHTLRFTQTQAHTGTETSTKMQMCTHRHTHVHTQTCAHRHTGQTHTQRQSHKCPHTPMHTNAGTHLRMNTDTQRFTRRHRYIQTHKDTSERTPTNMQRHRHANPQAQAHRNAQHADTSPRAVPHVWLLTVGPQAAPSLTRGGQAGQQPWGEGPRGQSHPPPPPSRRGGLLQAPL